MAASKLLLSKLRRYSHSLTRAPLSQLFHAPIPTQTCPSAHYFRPPFHFFHSRSVDSVNYSDGDSARIPSEIKNWSDGVVESSGDSVTIPSDIINLSEGVIGSSGGGESILPVRALISLLDAYHDLTGFPWWIVIASSTVALRFALFPLVVLQLKKIQSIGELFPICSIFPVLIAGLHYTNTQIAFWRSSLGKESGLFGLLAKYYKLYLYLWTVPLFFVGFYIPQGSLVYWVTNSSFSVIQQLSLKHPAIRTKLGLPDKAVSEVAAKSREIDTETNLLAPTKQRKISVKDLTPKQLLALSVQHLSKGQKESAIPLLQLALNKDPDYINALIVLGQTHMQKGLLAEAVEYLERAISKLFLAGHPTESEDVDLLIVASQWAGVACIRLGKWAEGIVHLERIGNLNEPEEPRSKAHYFDGLVILSSALSNVGRKAEAAKYLRLAVAYNSGYNELLEQLENDDGEFVSDLSSSRRQDY